MNELTRAEPWVEALWSAVDAVNKAMDSEDDDRINEAFAEFRNQCTVARIEALLDATERSDKRYEGWDADADRMSEAKPYG